jgi:hypothetical protein
MEELFWDDTENLMYTIAPRINVKGDDLLLHGVVLWASSIEA